MAITKAQKQDIVKKIEERLKEVKSVVFTNFSKLSVKDQEDLRRRLRKEEVEYYVIKKTLLKIALKEAGIDIPRDIEEVGGNIAIALGLKDEVSGAKVIVNFSKDHSTLEVWGGILEGKLLSREEVGEIAKLSSKEELYAKLVGSLNAPIYNLVYVLSGNIRKLINILKYVQ